MSSRVRHPNVAATIDIAALPVLPGALEVLRLGVETGGGGRNRAWVGAGFAADESVPAPEIALAADPQTSGGLLFSAGRRKRAKVEATFSAANVPLWRIGGTSAGAASMRLTKST